MHNVCARFALMTSLAVGCAVACSPDSTAAPASARNPVLIVAGTGVASGTAANSAFAGAQGLGSAGRGVAAPATAGSIGVAGVTPNRVPTAGAPATAGKPALPSAGMPAAGGAGATMPSAHGGDPSMCPAAPAGSTPEAVTALMTVNAARVAAGSGCMNMIAALNMSATNHCNYNAMNGSNAMCQGGGHSEVSGCMGFTGMDVAAREKAAGYSAVGATEVLTFYGNMPVQAVPSWIDTVWHRIPVLDPWTTDMGWGGAKGCDIIDFGKGMTGAPANTIVVYPYDGQTGVPPSFSGRESPVPPAPPAGWPSAYPVNIYAQKLNVTEHVLTKDGDSTPLEHVWMDAKSSNVDPGYKYYLNNTAFLYGNAAFAANTKYRVKITGTFGGGPLNVEWTFTTGKSNPFGP